MAARVFQIIGIVILVLSIFIMVIALPIISRMLKKLNRSFGAGAHGIREQMKSSLKDITNAQDQIKEIAIVTKSVKSGMESAIQVADKVVAFLKSGAFQFGLPLVLWLLLLVVAIPRGLRRPKKKQTKTVTPIPPPSWETEPD